MSGTNHLASHEQRQLLLQLARQTAARILGEPVPEASDRPVTPGTFGGVFVTIWNDKKLRGCVGRFGRTTDIARTVEEVTRGSLADERFAACPITAQELPHLTIEISILSDAVRTDAPLSLIPGVHGILIQKGSHSGCFLPKVAAERGWSAEEFLANCCSMKAGLPPGAWRDPDTEVLLFTAEVFSESDA